RKPVAGEAVASRPAAQESKVKLLKADDLRAWLRTSDNTIHIGEHSLDVDHARRIARDILELTTCPGNFGGPGPHSCVYCGGLLPCAVAPVVEGARQIEKEKDDQARVDRQPDSHVALPQRANGEK